MKRFVCAFSALALTFACNVVNNPDERIVTGAVLEVGKNSATISGYANLPIELGDSEVGIIYGGKHSLEDGQKIAASELDGENKFVVTVKGLSDGTTYYYKSYVQNGMAVEYGKVKSFTTIVSKCPAGAVDMGIEMTLADGSRYKLYWAQSNLCGSGLGANPEEHSDYFAWGELKPKSSFYWNTYRFLTSGNDENTARFSKYVTGSSSGALGHKITLEPEDDVAHVTLGDDWRMPTNEEWIKLFDKCKWKWTGNYNETGVSGIIVTADNGNSIFLPAGGQKYEKYHFDDGYSGVYWSSTLNEHNARSACTLQFTPKSINKNVANYRCSGLLIRPVSE